MIRNHDDEFVAVRVQDPRVQNEGLWNSYVDYKIFLHTNSKAFTAKTSCVRRRYSEFVWLKKKLQKNAGLVPVPNLPRKSFFTFSNENFLESRRKGLQAFLDKVVHMTVCLSDSQLHLFLQTQLPVSHIQDCVQGHTPYSVTEAILTYASSNWGLAQAQAQDQEDDSIKDPCLTISYESMESPAPHLPCLQTKETFNPKHLSCEDSDPLAGLLELSGKGTAELQHKEKSSIKISQKNNLLEAVVDCDRGSTAATFFLGDSPVEHQSHDPAGYNQQRSCQIQTPVEVHSPMGAGFEEDSGLESKEEEITESGENVRVKSCDTEDMQVNADQLDKPGPGNIKEIISESENCETSLVTGLKYNDSDEQVIGRNCSSQEEVFKVFSSDKQILENHLVSEVKHAVNTKGPVVDLRCAEEIMKSERQIQPNKKSYQCEGKVAKTLESEIHANTDIIIKDQDIENNGTLQKVDKNQVDQEVDLIGSKHEGDEDSHSLPSSNESIVQVSDEESTCDETEESIPALNGFMKASLDDVSHSSEVEATSRNILDLHMNGCPVEKEDISEAGENLSESGEISILETSCMPGVAEGEAWSSLTLDTSEETHKVQIC